MVQVQIEQTLEVQEALRDSQEPVLSVKALALIDTGASGTAVQSSLLSRFNILPAGQVLFNTPSTTKPQIRNKYRMRIVLTKDIAFEINVVDAPMGRQHVQCLIGRDILETCRFVYDGTRKRFTLTVQKEENLD